MEHDEWKLGGMRLRAFLAPLILISIPAGLGYLVLVPAFQHAKIGAQRSTCMSNVRQIALAYQQYLQDSQSVSPPVSIETTGWADLLQPYAKSWKVFQCPAGWKTSDTRRSDYFYNVRLAKSRKVPFPGQTILFGDGYDNSGSNAHLFELPLDWKTDKNSMERRHWLGLNCVFVDGHAKFCTFDRVSTQSPSTDIYNWKSTFALR